MSNYALDLSLRPVTGRAKSARPVPVRPAPECSVYRRLRRANTLLEPKACGLRSAASRYAP
jgi:hypothetical protein